MAKPSKKKRRRASPKDTLRRSRQRLGTLADMVAVASAQAQRFIKEAAREISRAEAKLPDDENLE